MATFNAIDFTLVGTDNAERIHSGSVTREFFDLLAVQPILGRTFVPEDTQTGQNRVVVLSNNLWQRLFGSNPNIIGQIIHLDATPYAVIGVLPPDFDFAIPGYFEARGLSVPAVLSQDHSERGHKYLS